jgi:GNAT superfamily N-acetyltransferase
VRTEVTLSNGERIIIRQVRADDKEDLLDGLHRLTPESRYRRFFSLTTELSTRELRYLTEVDHHSHEALVAVDPRTGEGIGEARFVRSRTDPAEAELAVAVLDDWQGCGVGTVLLEAVAARAREEGIKHFTASVLAHNSTMLDLFRRLGKTTVVDRALGVIELRIEPRPVTGLPSRILPA